MESSVLISKNEFQCKFINAIWSILAKKKEYDKFFIGFIKQTQPSISAYVLTSVHDDWIICCCIEDFRYAFIINNPYRCTSDYVLHLFLECYDLALTHFEEVIDERKRTNTSICESRG